MFKKLILGISLALLAPAVFAAKTFVYCSEGSPEGFYPALYTSGTTFDAAARPIYNRLVEFKLGTTQVVPGLAEKWDISKDGLTYTFNLRKGVTFHSNDVFKPNRNFNADDVLFSFNRMWKKDSPFHALSGGTYSYFEDMGFPDLLESIEKKDDYTVVFHLKKQEAPFIADLAMDFASIASAEYADALAKMGKKELMDQAPIGTGPFVFVSYQKDAFIRYKAFDAYWEGRAKIDNLVFAITADSAVRLQKLRANECQLMPYPNPADLASIKADTNLKVAEQQGLNIGYVSFNTEKKPLDNVLVRRALTMAVDKQAIIKSIYQGMGQPAINPIPPTMWSYNKNVKDYAYNPEQAKKLLAKAGVKDLKIDLWAMPVQRPYNPNAKRMAEMIQADWKKIGVEASIVSYEWGEYLKRAKNKEDTSMMMGWTGDNGDPDNFMGVLLGCDAVGSDNYAEWCNKEFDDLIKKAKATSDTKERTKLYEQAQVVFKREAPWITIAHSLVVVPMRKSVEGYVIHPLGTHDFYGVDLK